MKIGDLSIDNPVFLAPMAGVTDHAFRVICRSMGAGVVYSEFVSSEGIIRENQKTLDMMNFTEDERPIGIQIFGHNPEVVGKSAKLIRERFNPDIIDINYGCPVPKVVKKGAGSGALRDLVLMEDITRSVVENAGDIPVTIKMRAGIDNNTTVAIEAGGLLENCGARAITLHPRSMKQLYTGSANWELIKELKNAVNIPVIGNGDIQNASDAMRMFDETGCDGVMIARATQGYPWIFRSIKNQMDGQSTQPITISDKIRMCLTHFKLIRQERNDFLSLNLTKKHFSWYLKGFPEAVRWRKKFVRAESIQETEVLLKELFRHFLIDYPNDNSEPQDI
ncbi:MAG: tRNA dihydrouridine synthase DusB [Candidatus Marinimicrobia bacterium]|jgi:tRNA-dihydrouridine synthase B|nr:tRNA dihydrouridine synthase DusB [Candidatus Neomarinimicrobiota bacterium]MBT3633389.1 tRNA dihydrouridine synthase DusB [Candidatus Neomarinimicrobiota bacterium]MBT3681532.1 tRNA dihydrouridine synthase DusB [Candidatus Neomarinimicrobiota bacterium]MBT3758501.1 tRNA dihydrouridine synthase DusB [Candidatus Neomarinimicrobiota bacterium]MBT3894845.1 tRNA dihydrouridine synthase DusB [Candidatus Neomarinimicrobiota bacterium]